VIAPRDHGPRNPQPAAIKRETDVFIVGAGIMGLSIAYQLARRGLTDVVVVDKSYLAGGASGRNGGGVRMQWSSEMNVRLMRESIELCKGFAKELGVNVWLRQGGYLFLAKSDDERRRMEKNVALQNDNGVPTRMLAADEARHIVPDLDVSGVVAACYNPQDGILFPWPFLWGYASEAARRGVEVHPFTDVTAIEPDGGGGFRVRTSKGEVRARRVLDCAGAWSPEVARLVGVELPTHPHRHEILSTEPLKPFLGPMVSVLESGLYFSQSMRGEIVTGVTVPDSPDERIAGRADPDKHFSRDDGVKLGSRLLFLTTLAREITQVMPRLAGVRVLRQWAGPYDISPDGHPIVGELPTVPGFHLCCGFMGHGFMMAPVVGKHYAEWLVNGTEPPFARKWRLSRFAEGDVEREEMIIG
jgi:sarcosine oxidase subunit beta